MLTCAGLNFTRTRRTKSRVAYARIDTLCKMLVARGIIDVARRNTLVGQRGVVLRVSRI